MKIEKIRVGTRESQLALLQTDLVVQKLREAYKDLTIEVIPMSTKGDQILDRSLASFGGKGVFTKELEVALLNHTIDFAVHSAKDMPMEFPQGLTMGAVLEREEPSDILLTMDGIDIREMKAGSIIGTSSLRRELQIKQLNPNVIVKVLRGNVLTRLSKLEQGQYNGIILAAAGLKRLGIEGYPSTKYHMQPLLSNTFLPAPGQGILGIECREDDEEIKEILRKIHSYEGEAMLMAERMYLQQLHGGCNAPAGGYCRYEDGFLVMEGMYAKDGIHPKYERIVAKLPEEFVGRDEIAFEQIVPLAKELGVALAKKIHTGKVYLIGAGPGDEKLLTIRAKELIQKADVVVYDSLISKSLLQDTKKDCEWIYAGKRSNNHHLSQEETNQVLWKKAKEGKMVVRLKGGDPFIFGRGAEEALELREHGIDFEIVPGISSCYSVPAYAGIPVTDRRFASSFHVITGHEQEREDGERLDYEILAKEEGTLVFLMGVKQMEKICARLIQFGKDPKTETAIISQGTTRRQEVFVGTLETLPKLVQEKKIPTPAIFVVGKVVTFTKSLKWFEGNTHFKKRVLLTGTDTWIQSAKEKVEQFGAHPIPFSLIRVEPEEEEQIQRLFEERLDTFDWIVFTSRNGVRIFFEQWKKQKKDMRTLAKHKFAVIGKGTENELEKYGIYADFIPEKFSSEDMAKEWIPSLSQEERVLFMRAKEGNQQLGHYFQEAGICYEDFSLYHIVPEEKKKEELNRLMKEVDFVVLASGSVAKAMADMLEQPLEKTYEVLSIGPVTTKVANEVGLRVDQTAKEYSMEGILELLR